MKNTHHLKTINPHFSQIWDGLKTFEIRQDDRGYEVGDTLHLKETDQTGEVYTGREIYVKVSHMIRGGQYGIAQDYVVMSIQQSDELPF